MTEPVTDRYISFCGINCEENANALIEVLDKYLAQGAGPDKWVNYFVEKRKEQLKMERDNLHFIGNQINTLYQYFSLCSDDKAQALLYKIEQECC